MAHDGQPFRNPIRPRTKKEQEAYKKRWKKQQQGLGVYDHPKPPPKKKKVTPKKKP